MISLVADVIWHIPVTAQKSPFLTDTAEEASSLLCRKVDVRLSTASAAVCRRTGQRFTLISFASTSKTHNGVVDVLACEWLCAVEVFIAVLSFCNLNPCGFHFWHVYVLGPTYFVWPWKSREPSVTLTSHRGHWPLLIRVSGITWRGSKLLDKLSFIRVT
jgi:hypothetical protein